MATVLLIEPSMTGHRSSHLRWWITAAVERGHRALLGTTPAALEHAGFIRLESALRDRFEVIRSTAGGIGSSTHPPRGILGLWNAQKSHYAFAREIFERAGKVDFVFLPYLDPCVYSFSILGVPFRETPWAGTVMRPSFHYRRVGVCAPTPSIAKAREWLFFRLLRSRGLQTLFTNDPTLAECVEQRSPRLAPKLRFLPDAAEPLQTKSRDESRHELNLRPDSIVVLLFGAVTERKGLRALVRSMSDPGWPDQVDVLLAGVQDPAARRLLEGEPARRLRGTRRLHAIDRFLTDAETAATFAAADIVWCGYDGHYQMSGVLVLAGQSGKPVIACRQGLIGLLTNRQRSGIVLPDLEPQSIVRAVAALASDPDTARDMGSAGKSAFESFTVARVSSQVGALWS